MMTNDRKHFLRQFAKAQMVMYEVDTAESPDLNQSYAGWFFWNFYTESPIYQVCYTAAL